MGVNLAELNSRVFFGFGDLPSEYLSASDVHIAVTQKHSVRLNLSRISDINVLLSLTSEFSPSDQPLDITNLINKGVPSFVETLSESGGWQPIKVINIGDLAECRKIKDLACAFYGDESNGLRQYVQFSITPPAKCRIRYDKDTTPDLFTSISSLPFHVAELIVLEAMNFLIPKIKLKMLTNMNRKQQTQKDIQPYLNVLDDIRMQNMVDIEPLETLWKTWAFRDRMGQNSNQAKRYIPLGRNLY